MFPGVVSHWTFNMMTLTTEYYFDNIDDKLALYASDPEDNSCEHSHEFDELVIVDQGHGLHVFHYLQQIETLLSHFSAQQASCYGWLAPDTRIACKELIERIFSPNMQGAEKTALREACFFQLVTTLLHAQTQAEYSSTKYKLHKLLTWLQEHCFEEHNWQQLAESFHLTSRTAFRHIKEATGLTPDNYLKRLRLVSARVKLRETEMTVTEIAYLCGFANSNHFTTLYKKVYGLTPSEERRRALR